MGFLLLASISPASETRCYKQERRHPVVGDKAGSVDREHIMYLLLVYTVADSIPHLCVFILFYIIILTTIISAT